MGLARHLAGGDTEAKKARGLYRLTLQSQPVPESTTMMISNDHDRLTGGRLKGAFNWTQGLTSLQIHLLIDDSRTPWLCPVIPIPIPIIHFYIKLKLMILNIFE